MARPTLFRPEYAEQAYLLTQAGATDQQMADFFEVNISTIHNWKKEHPDFFNAQKVGKAIADIKVEESLYNRALGYTCDETKVFKTSEDELITKTVKRHYPPDTTSMIFWLKNRRPQDWRDVHKHEHTADVADMEEKTTMELARRVAHLLTHAADKLH